MKKTADKCFINGKEFSLSEIEKMGYESFSLMCHICPCRSLFKYYPNIRKYIKEEKRYRNYSIEALKNNSVYLQDAKNFDDCFDCAVDLEWNMFLAEKINVYCKYFKAEFNSDNIIDMAYVLSLRLYELGTVENCIQAISFIQDEIQRKYIEVFIREVFVQVSSNEQWITAIFNSIRNEFEKFDQILSNFKITCFSTSPYLNRMWSSAYADNNRGFCIEYEIDTSTETGMIIYNNLYPVIYSTKRGDLFPLSKNNDRTPSKEDLWQMYFNGLLRKNVIWQDQQEWRLIIYKDLMAENPMQFYKIKKVYLGNKMPLKARKQIARYCRKNNIEYVGLVRKPTSYDFVECNDDCYRCKKHKIKHMN